PTALLTEAARVLQPQGLLFAAEVFNHSLYLFPPAPYTERYWRAFNDCQRALGGDPNVGPRLPGMALCAGLTVDRLSDVSFTLDARTRNPDQRHAMVQYWRDLLASGASALLKGGYIDASVLPGMAQELDRLENDPEALLVYSGRTLQAHKPLPA
ncbi:MAG TPA: hypothetical protein VFN52_00140, partial [Acidiferrobacteraceae bacterium]|nr:hypothetical protein [Acidiferrobacteraceae bacterium]